MSEIPEEQVELERGYYSCVYVMMWFKKEVGVNSKEDQVDMEEDTGEEDMDNIIYGHEGTSLEDGVRMTMMEGWTMQRNCDMIIGVMPM